MDYQQHPIGQIYPPLVGQEFRDLVNNIIVAGQQKAIELYDGKIIDGWNRYLACLAAKVEPWVVDVTGEINNGPGPAAWVLQANQFRRHMTPADLAVTAAKFKRLESSQGEPITTAAAAAAVGASVRSTRRAGKVIDEGSDELKEAVDTGLPLTEAAEIASLPKKDQAAAVKSAKGGRAATCKKKDVPENIKTTDEANAIIRSWANGLPKMAKALAGCVWVTESDLALLTAELKSVASTARQWVATFDCPECDAKGCKTCRQTGRIPNSIKRIL